VSPLTIDSCTFQANLGDATSPSSSLGGALYLAGAQSTRIRSSLFFRNGAGSRKGDIYMAAGSLNMTNVLVAQNGPNDGVKVAAGSALLVNCTFAQNGGSGVYNVGAGVTTARQCIAWGNVYSGLSNCTAVSYSDSQEPIVGTGNIATDPLFVDTNYYHVKSGAAHYVGGYFTGGTWSVSTVYSPCIDTGDPASDWSKEPDYPRGRINLGAYGNTPVASRGVPPPGTLVFVR
jgi:hypothetical protein